MNFKLKCQGNTAAAGYFQGNLNTLVKLRWIGADTRREALAIGQPPSAADKLGEAKQAMWMLITSRGAINATKIDRVVALLSAARLGKSGETSARNLLDAYRELDPTGWRSNNIWNASPDVMVKHLTRCLDLLRGATAALPAGKAAVLRTTWTNRRNFFRPLVGKYAKVAEATPEQRAQAAEVAGAPRAKLERLVEDLRYLDATLRPSNYGSLHPYTTLFGDIARNWGLQQLPRLEAVLTRDMPGEIDSALSAAHFEVTIDGRKLGPRQLADYVIETNDSTLGWMERISDFASLIPGLGIGAKLCFSGSVELIKVAQNKQSLTTAITKTVTAGITGALGPKLGGFGPGKAILRALLGAAANIANDLSAVLTDPKTSWSEVPEKINIIVARAMLNAFIGVILDQAKLLSGATNNDSANPAEMLEKREVRQKFYDLAIDIAAKFGLDEAVKAQLDKLLPINPGR